MKIVCESCSAKYSIADEKVAGKVFKIRCKRCSEVIVVRGDQQQPEEDATRVYDGGGDAVWHVVVDGEQQGPFAPVQIGEMLTNAQIDWEAYVWREGFDNWLPARDVPELVEAVTGQSAGGYEEETAPPEEEAYEAPAPAAAPVSVRAQTQPRSMGADPFADDGAADGGLFGGGGGGGDLFGGGGAAAPNPFGGGHDDGVVASAPNPRVTSAQSMTGARNENSVLFSLKNLQALATGGNEGGGGSSASPAPRAGFATGEGSGLIDIRALASATGLGNDSGGGDKDELLSMGGGQTGAFGSLGSPMLAAPLAAASEPPKANTMLYVGFGVLTLVVLGMGGGMFYLLTKEPPQPAIVQVPVPVAAAAAATPAAAEPAAAAEEPTEGEKAAAKAAAEAAEKEKEDEGEGSSSSRRRRSSSGGSSSGSSSSGESSGSSSTEAAPAKAPARTGANATIDDLLGGALGGGAASSKKAAPAAAPASNLPEQPSRDDVMNSLRSVEDAVKACGGGQHGVAMAAITVAGSTGRVSSVNVSGQFQGTPVGSCVARAVRGAKFPKFSRSDFKVNFPFRI